MIDRAGILRTIDAHFRLIRTGSTVDDQCEEVNAIVRLLVAENDKLTTENMKLLDRISKAES